MNLAQSLRPDQTYIPVDVVARDARTLVCDLNCQAPPNTGATSAALLGLLEYLHDPGAVLRQLGSQYSVIVVSYNVADAPHSAPNRREHAWVNDFTNASLRELFRAAGWRPDEERTVDERQTMWRLTRWPSEGESD
jgi:hypothetical protein